MWRQQGRQGWGIWLVAMIQIAISAGMLSAAEPASSLRSASVRTRSVVQDCGLGRACLIRAQWGSGTVIGRWRGQWAVLTCWHTLFRNGTHTVDRGDGVRYPATLIAAEPSLDLAVLTFAAESWGCLSLAEQSPARGEWLTRGGFPGGQQYQELQVRYEGRCGGRADLLLTSAAQQGESGGGIISQGGLVGVLWGTDPRAGQSLAVSLEQIREFLQRRNIQIEPCGTSQPTSPGTPVSPPTPPAVVQSPTVPVIPSTADTCRCATEIRELRSHLAQLVAQQAQASRSVARALEERLKSLQEHGASAAQLIQIRQEVAQLRQEFREFEATLIVEITPIP